MSVGETVVPVRGTEIAKVTLIYSCIRYQGGNLVSVGETLVPGIATVRGTETAKVTLINSCIRYQGGNLVSVGETLVPGIATVIAKVTLRDQKQLYKG